MNTNSSDDSRVEHHPRRPSRYRTTPMHHKLSGMDRINSLAQPRTRKTKKSLLQLLPVANVSYHVLSFLDRNSLLAAGCTCKEMLRLCSVNVLWKEIWDRRYKGRKQVPPEFQNAEEDSLKQIMLYRNRQLVVKREKAVVEKLTKIKNRVGLENSLTAVLDQLKPELSVEVNDQACDLLAFRTKKQQGTKLDFRVHAASPAPNLSAGALRFDLSTVMKVAVPPGLRVRDLKTVKILCRCQGPLKQRRKAKVILNVDIPRNSGFDQEIRDEERNARYVTIQSGKGSTVVYGIMEASQGEHIDLLLINFNHLDLLAGLGLFGARPHVPIVDDVDTRYGLHNFTCSIALRSFGQTWWGGNFRDVETRDSITSKVATFPILVPEKCEGDITRKVMLKTKRGEIANKPELYYRTETFSGSIPSCAIVDMTLWDEHGEIYWTFSKVLRCLHLPNHGLSYTFDTHDPESTFTLTNQESGVGRFQLTCTNMPPYGLVVHSCIIELQTQTLKKWFPRS